MTDFTDRVLQARSRFGVMCAEPVSLDITRGKPSAEQLDLSRDLLTVLRPDDFKDGRGK